MGDIDVGGVAGVSDVGARVCILVAGVRGVLTPPSMLPVMYQSKQVFR